MFAAVAHKVASVHPAPGICAPCAPSPGRAARICRAPPQSDKAQRGAPGGTRGSEGARAGGAGPRCAGWGRLRAPRGSGGGEHRVHPPPPVRCSNSGRETAACETFPAPGRRGPRWLPYVFNKIRQIGPGDRACSKPVVKEHKMGQCKRGRGPLGATPRRRARPGASGSATRSPRGFLSRPRRYCAGSAPVGKHTGRLCAARGSYREAAGEGDVTMPLSRPPAGDVCPRPRD